MKKLDSGFGIARLLVLTTGLSVFLGTLSVICPPGARAVAFRLPNQDPEAIGRGNAFVATADNPSAIYYNPAGITQLEGNDLQLGVYAVSPGIKYTSPGGESDTARSYFQYVPQIYYTYAPTNSIFAFGLGVYAPYGLGLDWGNNTPFNTVAEKGQVLYACVNPVMAVKLSPKLSFAVGPTYNYSQAEFARGIGFIPGDQFEFKGTGFDFGFNTGLFWQPIRQLAFGVSYRFKTEINYQGYSRTTPSPPYPQATDTSGTLKYPEYVIGGVSYRPTKNWNLEVDLDWTDWNSDKQIVFNNTAFGNVPLTLNYRDSMMYEFGVTRQLPAGYYVSVGYFYSENSSPDANFSPIVPDSNLQLGCAGFGYHGKHFDWAAAYQFGYNGGRTVENDVSPQADGTYKTFNQAFNLSVGFKF